MIIYFLFGSYIKIKYNEDYGQIQTLTIIIYINDNNEIKIDECDFIQKRRQKKVKINKKINQLKYLIKKKMKNTIEKEIFILSNKYYYNLKGNKIMKYSNNMVNRSQ